MVEAGMKKHTCWKPEMLHEVLNADALYVKDHLFLATHHPIKMYKQTAALKVGGNGTPYTEDQFLRDFLKADDYIFTAILGESGTGKSHLIRWLSANVPPSSKRHLIQIPRFTNLKQILLLMLEGMEGPKFDEYRNRIEHSTGSLTFEQAKENLLYNIALCSGPNAKDAKIESEFDDYFHEELHNILLDSYFRKQFLREGALIHRLTQHIIGQDEQGGRANERREFTIKDLPLDQVDLKEVGKPAYRVYNELLQEPDLQVACIEYLNKHLDEAIARMFSFSNGELLDLLNMVRSALGREGIELVLLIEDFTMLQGLDHQFLRALLLQADKQNPELCSLRVALACTTGYFQKLDDTITRRVEFRINLDVDKQIMRNEDIERFVAKYLNAVRLPESQIESWYRDTQIGTLSTSEIGSACRMMECPFIERCHDAFGSIDGQGLYPFNREAIHIMYERVTGEERFNPRFMLSQVIKHTLDNYGDHVASGMFPPAAMFDHFGSRKKNRLAPVQLKKLQSSDPQNADRRETLIELWSYNNDVVNLHPTVHEAFLLPMLSGTSSSLESVDNQQSKVIEATTSELPERVQAHISALKMWNNDGTPPSRYVSDFRDLLYEAINHYINWDGEGLNLKWMNDNRIWRPAYISFQKQTTKKFDNKCVTLNLPATDDQLLDTTIALEGLVLYRHFGHWKFERGPEYFRMFVGYLNAWSEVVLLQMKRIPLEDGGDWNPTETVVEVLQLGAIMAGLTSYKHSAEEQVPALFMGKPKPQEFRSRTWRKLQEELQSSHSEFRDLLLSRTACLKGQVRNYKMIDAVPVLQAIRNFEPSLLLQTNPKQRINEFTKLQTMHQHLSQSLEQAVNEECEQKQVWYERVNDKLGVEPDIVQIAKDVEAAFQKAIEAGRLSGDRQAIQVQIRSFKQVALKACMQEIASLPACSTLGEKVLKLGRLDVDLMKKLDEFLTIIDTFLTNSLKWVNRDIDDLQGNKDSQDTEQTRQAIEHQFDLMLLCLDQAQGGEQP